MDRNNKKPIALWDEINFLPYGIITAQSNPDVLAAALKQYEYVRTCSVFESTIPFAFFSKKCIACGRQVRAKLEAPGVITHETCCN